MSSNECKSNNKKNFHRGGIHTTSKKKLFKDQFLANDC